MRGALRDRWLALHNRLLSSRAFQLWALRFPLTRPIARRRAGALFDLCAGFVYSQILLACVQLGLLELLRQAPRSVASLAKELRLTPEAALTLLNAAAALGLVQWQVRGRSCGLGRHGAALLANPGLLPMIEHHRLLYADLLDPVALLREERRVDGLGSFWWYARQAEPAAGPPERVAAYTSLMSASQSFIGWEVLDACDLGEYRHLLDVGGGDGTFCAAAAARWPRLVVTCFDLPAVAERARSRFAEAGISERAHPVGGSFLSDALPSGSDVISLIRVLHDHDDGQVVRILRSVREALEPGGTLLIAEPLAGAHGGAEAYFGFYLLAMGSGKPRTLGQLAALLRAAGFRPPSPRRTRLPMNLQVLTARAM